MPQPVDMQTEVARTTTVERIQQVADRASLAAQQRQAIEEEEVRLTKETVVRQPEPKGTEVDTEARRRAPFAGRRRRRKGSQPAKKQGQAEPGATDPDDHAFDVRV